MSIENLISNKKAAIDKAKLMIGHYSFKLFQEKIPNSTVQKQLTITKGSTSFIKTRFEKKKPIKTAKKSATYTNRTESDENYNYS